MKRLLTACVAVLGVIFCVGFILPVERPPIRITAADNTRHLDVTVSLFDLQPSYRWVGIHACTADRSEDMQTYCNYFWEARSTHPTRADQNQYPFPLRNVPGGLIVITAEVWDIDDNVLARAVIPYNKRR